MQEVYTLEYIAGPCANPPIKHVFDGKKPLVIGKHGDYRIQQDIKISRIHAKIEIKNGQPWLMDMQSSNGIFINEKRVIQAFLTSGTVFQVGNSKLRFLINKPSSKKIALSKTKEKVFTEGFYHLHIQIARTAFFYGIKTEKDVIKSNVYFFQSPAQGFSWSIGDSSDTIEVKGLTAKSIVCKLNNQGLQIQSKQDCQLMAYQLHQKLAPEETINLTLFHLKEPYRIIFPTNIAIAGKVFKEQENLSSSALTFLKDKYGSLQKIREGKSSLIYRTDQGQALKILRPSFAKNKGVITRFLTSANKVKECDPSRLNICEVVSKNDLELHYLTMEYFAGETLENTLGKQGILSLQEAKKLIISIAKNLQVFAELNTPCRNLAPDNILVCSNGTTKITSSFLIKTDTPLTAEGAQMIIPKYSAPEQILNPSEVDIAADLFSLGSIFYTLLIGQSPSEGLSPTQYLSFINKTESYTADNIYKIAPYIPKDICELINLLLSYEKEKRPTCKELIEQLTENDAGKELFTPKNALEEDVTLADKPKVFDNPKTFQEEEREDLESKYQEALKDIYENVLYSLEVIESPAVKIGRKYTFKDGSVLIGKQGELSLTEDMRISRRHAQLEIIEGECWLEDLESTNGTYIDEREIVREKIDVGDVFLVGETQIRLNKEDISLADEEVSDLVEIKLDPQKSDLEKSKERIRMQMAKTQVISLKEFTKTQVFKKPQIEAMQESLGKKRKEELKASIKQKKVQKEAEDIVVVKNKEKDYLIREKPQKQPATKRSILIASFLFVFSFVAFYTRPSPKPIKRQKERKTSQKQSKKSTSAVVRPKIKKIKWHTFTVSLQEKHILKDLCQEDGYLANFKLQIAYLHFKYSKPKKALFLRGKLKAPVLPKSKRLQLEATLLTAQEAIFMSETVKFFLKTDNTFEARFNTGSLFPNLYYLQIHLDHKKQSKFLQYFLQLKNRQSYKTPFTIGAQKDVIKYQQKLLERFNKVLLNYNNSYQNLLGYSQKKRRYIKKMWKTWLPVWHQKLKKVNKNLERLKKLSEIPVFPKIEQELKLLLFYLKEIFQKIEKWQQSFSLKPVDIAYEKVKFQNKYDEILLLLQQTSFPKFPKQKLLEAKY